MRFLARKSFRVWPFRVTVNQGGRWSWGLKVWRWSWSARTGRHTFDTPGPGYVQSRGRRRRPSPDRGDR